MKLLLFLERQLNRVTLKTDDIIVGYFCSGKCSPGEHTRLHMDFVILSTPKLVVWYKKWLHIQLKCVEGSSQL